MLSGHHAFPWRTGQKRRCPRKHLTSEKRTEGAAVLGLRDVREVELGWTHIGSDHASERATVVHPCWVCVIEGLEQPECGCDHDGVVYCEARSMLLAVVVVGSKSVDLIELEMGVAGEIGPAKAAN